MTEDEWVKAAMLNDSMVVELLLGLHHSTAKPNPKPALSLDWSVRQRRSKQVTVRPKKAATRDSPTTPLSWSGATSVSCGGGVGNGSAGAVDGGPEESSSPPPPPPSSKASGKARSKLNGTNEKSTTKRSRRKKTLAELREDEIVLLRERRLLKKELAMLRVNLETQRTTNANLKRMKLDLQSQPTSERDPTSTFHAISPALQQNSAQLQQSYTTANNISAEQEEVTDLQIRFELPDLNLPLEADDGGHEVQCGMN